MLDVDSNLFALILFFFTNLAVAKVTVEIPETGFFYIFFLTRV